jgi:hypothetical protein
MLLRLHFRFEECSVAKVEEEKLELGDTGGRNRPGWTPSCAGADMW